MADSLDHIFDRHTGREGPLLPILHDVQMEFGFIAEQHVHDIASRLNLTRAEVHGVVSFYHDFRREPETRPTIKLCRAEACQARGVEAMVDALDSTASKKVNLEPVYCLGLCSAGPAALVGDNVYARLTMDKLNKLIGDAQ